MNTEKPTISKHTRVSERPYLGWDGVLKPGRFGWLRALGWMLALLAMLVLVLSLQSIVKSVDPDPGLVLAMAFVCTILAYLGYAGLVRLAERRPVFELAPGKLIIELPLGLAIGAGAMGIVMCLLWMAGLYHIEQGGWTDWAHDLREALGTGLLEELLARLVVFRLVARAFGSTASLVVSAIAFGLAHLGNDNATVFSSLAIAVEAGLMLAGFYLLTGRIWLSVGVHAGWNLTQGGVFGARVSGLVSDGSLFQSAPTPGSSTVLSGGAFGPEGSIAAIAVGLLIFAATMALRSRLQAERT